MTIDQMIFLNMQQMHRQNLHLSLNLTFPWALSANIPILLPTSLSLALMWLPNREVTMYLLKYILRHAVSWGSPSSHLAAHNEV